MNRSHQVEDGVTHTIYWLLLFIVLVAGRGKKKKKTTTVNCIQFNNQPKVLRRVIKSEFVLEILLKESITSLNLDCIP